MTVSEVIQKEHFDVAIQKVLMGNSITSLKNIQRINFLEIFEKINGVEDVLKQDPSNVYPNMDWKTKEYYRNKIKEISEKMKINVSAEQINLSPERYYGKIALNYTKENLTYRIFYVDKNNEFGDGKNTIYLKADWNENNIRLTDYIKYEPKDKDLEIYKRMNKKWSEKRGTLKSSSWNDNERAVSWLSSASQWEKYKDNSKANYAIGTPSVEMYVASYNQVSHKEIGNYILGAEYREIEVPGYIYTLDGKQSTVSNNDYYAGTDTIDYKGYGGMYAGRKSSKYFWLASPLSEGINYVCMISGNYAGLSKDNYTGLNGICPTICIKEGIKIEVEE